MKLNCFYDPNSHLSLVPRRVSHCYGLEKITKITSITREEKQSMSILFLKEPKKRDIFKYQAKPENTDANLYFSASPYDFRPFSR